MTPDQKPEDTPRLRLNGEGQEPPRSPEAAHLAGLEADARIGKAGEATRRYLDGLSEALSPDEVEQCLANLREFLTRTGLSNQQFARQAGISPASLCELLANRYRGNVSRMIARCQATVEELVRREDAPTAARFVSTGVARRIFTLIKAATKLRTMGIVYGPSGLGKSMAVAACVRLELPNAVLLSADPSCRSPRNLCRAIAKQLYGGRLDVSSIVSQADGFARIVAKLKDSERTIIIDEADCLTTQSLNLLRYVHDVSGSDDTRCAVVLVGRPILAKRIAATVKDPEIGGSLRGRLSFEHNLAADAACTGDGDSAWLFSVEEVMEVLARMKVRLSRDAGRWLCALANLSLLSDGGSEGGGMRYAIKVAQLARTANPGAEELGQEQVRVAARFTRDRWTAETLENQIRTALGRREAQAATA